MRGERALYLTAFLAVLFPLTLHAQEGLRNRDPQLDQAKAIAADLQKATFHDGPFYLLSTIELSDIGFQGSYYLPTSEQGKGLNFGLSAPNRLYFVKSKKTIWSVDAVPSYTFLNGRKGQFGILFRGDAQYVLNHVYLDFYASHFNKLGSDTGEINRILTTREREYGVKSELKYTSRTSLKIQGSYVDITHPSSRLQPPDRPVQLLDRTENNFRVALLHKTFPITSFRLAAEANSYNFKRATSKDSKRTYSGAGVNYDNGRSTIDAEVGVASLRFEQQGQKDFQGTVGSVGASRRLGTRWAVSANAVRDVAFSIFENNNYYIVDHATAKAEYAASRRLSLVFTSQAGRDNYEVISNGRLRHDQYTFNTIGFLYAYRYLRGGLDIGPYNRTSNVEDGQHGIRVVLHLSFTP